MVPWFFALNHTNYARWLTVHPRDIYALQHEVPDVHQRFTNGLFVVHKTQRRFSAIPVDQAHEQNNALVKREGGAAGLTENPNALRHCMVTGPEIARVINEFEACLTTESKPNQPSCDHHDEVQSQHSRKQSK